MTQNERQIDQCREENRSLASFLSRQRRRPRARLVTFKDHDFTDAWYAAHPHVHWLYTDDGAFSMKDFEQLAASFDGGRLEHVETRSITADEADRLNAQDWTIGARDEGLLITVRCTLNRYRRPEQQCRRSQQYVFNPILDGNLTV